MAAITGLRHSSRLLTLACRPTISRRNLSRLRASQLTSMARCMFISIARSMPAQKCLPLPDSTTARTSGCASHHSIACCNSCHIASFSELALSGRFSTTWATCCRTSTVIVS
ncbi:hypothetical protein D3C78_1467170 [compost metagenome]